ncbi:MAG: GTP cyclohydrolase I FolE2 [Planctomycetes bacterium]|nr:GTP cyclohydrolase I FolE2 [Planctomycetota bacterium]
MLHRRDKLTLEDVQNSAPEIEMLIDKVGVTDLRYPIAVLDKENNLQHTCAHISMSVSVPQHFKGTHMSRFVEILNRHRGEITMRTIPEILKELKQELEAESAYIEVKFPYFIEKSAPVTKQKGLMDYECIFMGQSNGTEDDFVLSVRVPVTSLCPCSKAISEYGSHNQRGYITIDIRSSRDKDGKFQLIWIEELIEIAEQSASAPVYPLLKREDERHVTMQAYDNPVFVEDMVRSVAQMLQEDSRIAWFKVHAENHESIHNHNAFAEIERSTKISPNLDYVKSRKEQQTHATT